MELPRPYLSYSAFSLWKSSKEGFRKRYYLNEQIFDTQQSRFGKEQHSKMEENPDVKGSETRLECEVEGIKLLGYVDSLCPDTLKIIDFKFSHLSKTGKEPWDVVKVRKHQQFPFYCLMVKTLHGKYNPDVELHWHETKFNDNTREFDGHILTTDRRGDMDVTGKVSIIKRTVAEYELDNIKEEIINVTREISNDYTLWKSTNNTQN
jgi:hypothetical protein